jgi:hypothetical protein
VNEVCPLTFDCMFQTIQRTPLPCVLGKPPAVRDPRCLSND